MLHHLQLLLLRRAQQGGKRRVRYIFDKPIPTYSPEIEELIDRFDLELPETAAVFVEQPSEALKKPLEAVSDRSSTPSTINKPQSLVGAINELKKALAKLTEKEAEKKQAVQKVLELVQKQQKENILRKKRIEEELLLEFIL